VREKELLQLFETGAKLTLPKTDDAMAELEKIM
jgi:hypothetical protein